MSDERSAIPAGHTANALDASIRLERHAERLRQERETFNQRKEQDGRWVTLRLAMGWLAFIMLPAIAVLCAVVMLSPEQYSAATVTTATAALLADTLGLILSVWKVLLAKGPDDLGPVTRADDENQ